MKCFICDKTLSGDEVQFDRDHQEWDPCGTCLDVINNVFEPKSEEEIDWELAEEMSPEDLLLWYAEQEDKDSS